MIEDVRAAARKRILFLPHAVRQMSRPERMITTGDVRAVVFEGAVIEAYPDDPRGRSCLMLGWIRDERPVHVVCAPKGDYLAVITAYAPDSGQWSPDFTRREES